MSSHGRKIFWSSWQNRENHREKWAVVSKARVFNGVLFYGKRSRESLLGFERFSKFQAYITLVGMT